MNRSWPNLVAQFLPDQVVQAMLDRVANCEPLPDHAGRGHFEIGPIALTEIEAPSRAATVASRPNQPKRN